MPRHSRLAILLRVGLLPLVLLGASVAGLGSYCEASDDLTLSWLFSGVVALKPVATLPLYFHGLGYLLAGAYAAAPQVPWYGLLLGGLLAGATVLIFAVLDKLLRPHLSPAALALVLIVFFALAWVEHWLWFSYVRVALLLAGAGVLFAAQRPGRRWPILLALAGLAVAWLMRPSQALLALGAALPGAIALAGSLRRALPLLLSAAVLLGLAAGLNSRTETPAEARLRQRDTQLARILDFELLRPAPRTAADSQGTAAINLWLLGDTALVDQTLQRGVYQFDAAAFFGRTLPAKLRLRLGLLGRDYFPLLLALLATAVVVGRRPAGRGWFGLVQLGFVGALLLLAGLAKLPPRLALPLLDFWLLTNLIFWLLPAGSGPGVVGEERRAMTEPAWGGRPGLRWVVVGACLLVLLAYGLKTAHRRQVLRYDQQVHLRALQALRQIPAGTVRVLGGTNDLLKSLSPFRVASPGPGPVLLLTGWPAQDASQAELRRSLTGEVGQPQCLARLAQPAGQGQPGPVCWVLTRPISRWLGRWRGPGGAALTFHDLGPLVVSGDTTLRHYQVQTVIKP